MSEQPPSEQGDSPRLVQREQQERLDAEIRREAEGRLRGQPAPAAADTRDRLLHELRVHQAELEMQNEHLRQAHAALEASRDRYADLYREAPVGYVTFSLDGVIIEANRMAADMLAAVLPRLSGRHLTDLIAYDDRLGFQRCQRELAAGHGPLTLELRLARERGQEPWVQLHVALVHDERGVPQCRAALLDITERVRSQEKVSLLAAIVSSSEDAIVSRDLAGRVTSWNDAAARLFGMTAGDMVGQSMDIFVPDERRGEEAALLRRLRDGERITQLETERCDAAGTRIALSLSLSPVRDARGAVVASALIARNISQRWRDDVALRARVRQLDALSYAGRELIMGKLNPLAVQQQLFDRVSEALDCELHLNYVLGEAPGTLALLHARGFGGELLSRMQVVAFADTLCGMAAEQRQHMVFDGLQQSTLPQARLLQAAGARCYAVFPLIAGGRVCGVAGFASTTRERFADTELQVMRTVCDQTSAMLERARLLDELHASEQSLKRADRAKDEFIATLAHELRNPLAPIRNAVGLLRHEGQRDPQLAWCRDIIDRQVVQMTHLLEDLLDVSRLSRNKIELRRDRIELRQAVEQALETTRPLIDAQGQRLALDLPREPVTLCGDLTRLTQVFANLLSNAAKYTDIGGQIGLSARHADGWVEITVRDSGIGIEPEHLPHVFDMFSQLAPALQRARGGLGIGLALTRGLVQLHGGTVTAHSDGNGHGSEFVVRLPLAAASPCGEAGPPGEAGRVSEGSHRSEASPFTEDKPLREAGHSRGVPEDHPPPAAAPGAQPPRRVLVVDDHIDAAQTLSALLALQGYEVRTAYSGVDALRVADEWPFDVGVFDIGLPDISGYELCRSIRQRHAEQPPLLIACTGWGQQDDVARAKEAGFGFHLVKPVDPGAVVELLARAGTHAVH